MSQDMNAEMEAPSVATDRAIAKSKNNIYKNSSWDLLDAVNEGEKDITTMPEEELPDEFKGKTEAEKKALIALKNKERESHQKKIAELAFKREEFIAQELEKRAEAGEDVDDFGTSINTSILEKAKEIGYTKETPNME